MGVAQLLFDPLPPERSELAHPAVEAEADPPLIYRSRVGPEKGGEQGVRCIATIGEKQMPDVLYRDALQILVLLLLQLQVLQQMQLQVLFVRAVLLQTL